MAVGQKEWAVGGFPFSSPFSYSGDWWHLLLTLLKSKPNIKFDLEQPITVQPWCVKLGGDFTVGRLLSQIAFWYQPGKKGKSKLRVYRANFWWIAKSRYQWCLETGLTLNQYRRAVSVLQARGIIKVRQMIFGGVSITHIRLLHSVALLEGGGKSLTGVRHNHSPRWGIITHAVRTEDITEEDNRTCDTVARDQGEIQEREQGETKREDEEETMRAEDILKGRAHSSGSLTAHWKACCAESLGGYQKALTAKQNGQLKQLQGHLGEDTKAVIEYAVMHWWKFASLASTEAGTGSWPTAPHVGFLLQHHAVAVHLMHSIAQVVPVEQPPVVELELEPVKETPKHLTQEELDQMIAGLNDV